MIENITIKNFFSFGEKQTIELNKDTNILLGINGSGKSNLLKALQVLYEGVLGKGFQELFMKDWGGFDNVGNFSKKRAEDLFLRYQFTNKIVYFLGIEKLNSQHYILRETFYKAEKKGIINLNSGGIFKYDFPMEQWGKISSDELNKYKKKIVKYTIPNRNELGLKQVLNTNLPYVKEIRAFVQELVVYTYFDTTLKSPIRQLSSYSIEHRLASNGENLIQVLLRIKNHHSLAYEKIEDALKTINPLFKDISFDIIASKVLLVLREKGLAKSVTIEHISDGTLRYLLLLSIVFNPERGKIICLDEPEIGLHPDMINSIAKAIKEAAAEGTQFIIATHSPLLLNCFELEDVLIFEKNEANESVVSYKSEEDFEEDGLLVGQRWLSGQLGGVRW